MDASMNEDCSWMDEAIALAKEAYGLCSPNPMVGAVVVKGGVKVGEGYHHKAGQPHAEPNALDDAGEAAKDATLYVTLEPCSTYGRTPPCTERIKRSGVKRVVIGVLDVNPKHAGAAVEILREAGIEVTVGVREEECRRMNEAFFWWIRERKPFVTLKMAMTLDGKIATANGSSKWISGPQAREYVQILRRGADAVMVGGVTALADNPSLLVRTPANWPAQPRRIVWTSRPLPPTLAMFSDGGPAPEAAKPTNYAEWDTFLRSLASENVTSLLLEGGGELAANALRSCAVNKVVWFVAPKILGGRNSRPVVGGDDVHSLDDALYIEGMETTSIGDDLLITGYCQNVHGNH